MPCREGMIKPAIRHVFNTVVLQWDRVEMLEYFESIYNIFSVTLDGYYLFSEYSSTFIEHLYGLRRIPYKTSSSSSSSSDTSLNKFQRTMSVAFLLMAPRIIGWIRGLKETLLRDDSTAVNNDSNNNNNADSNPESQQSRWIKYLQRILMRFCLLLGEWGVSIEAISLMMFRLFYLLKQLPFHHPLFYLLRMKLVKYHKYQQTMLTAKENDSSSSSSPRQSQVQQHSSRNWQMSVIIALIMAVRGLEWYMNNDFSADQLTNKLHNNKSQLIPPYPKPLPVNKREGIIPPNDKSLCPLCLEKRSNPCAINSGYVFCYQCILPYLRKWHRCPITLLPCQEGDLIKLYENHS